MDVTIWSTTDTASQVHYVFYTMSVSCLPLTVCQNLHMKVIFSLTIKEHFIAATVGMKCVKGKSVPLQAWSGPEGSRKLRFPDFMTTAQKGCKVVSLTHRRHFSLGTHFC